MLDKMEIQITINHYQMQKLLEGYEEYNEKVSHRQDLNQTLSRCLEYGIEAFKKMKKVV